MCIILERTQKGPMRQVSHPHLVSEVVLDKAQIPSLLLKGRGRTEGKSQRSESSVQRQQGDFSGHHPSSDPAR